MEKRGRKTKLTKELIKEASDIIKMGNYVKTVCDYLGINESTWYDWLKQGEKAKSGLKMEFSKSIKKAQAHAEIRNLAIIETAAKEEWQAAAWYLERKFPNQWGRKERQKIEHSGNLGININIRGSRDNEH